MHALLHLMPPTLKWVTANPRLHWRLLDTHGQVWVSLLWGHCSFLLGTGVYKVLFVPSRHLFPQFCVRSGGSMVGLMATSSKRVMPFPGLLHPEACPWGWALLTRTSSGDTQTQFCLSFRGVSGSWCTRGLFEPSERLWQVWGLIPNVNSPLLLSCWGFSFALGHGVSPHSRLSACCLSVLEWNVLECKPCHFIAVWPLSGYVILCCIFSLHIMWVIITSTLENFCKN